MYNSVLELAQQNHHACLQAATRHVRPQAKQADMAEIMQTMQRCLGEEFLPNKKVLSGGDQLTCVRHVGVQRHRCGAAHGESSLVHNQCQSYH